MLTNIRALFEELARALSIPEIKLDSKGTASIALKNNIDVYFNYLEANAILIMYASLGQVENTNVYERMLMGNFFWNETDGATLSITPENKTVILAMQIGVQGLNMNNLTGIIDTFLTNIEKWKKIIQDKKLKSSKSAATKEGKFSDINDEDPSSIKI